MKKLPKKLGEEIFMSLNYANCRFMDSKRAYRTRYNQQCIFTAKVVEGDEDNKKIKLLQIHLRTPAEDRWFNKKEDLDIDIYIPEKDFPNLIKILKEDDI